MDIKAVIRVVSKPSLDWNNNRKSRLEFESRLKYFDLSVPQLSFCFLASVSGLDLLRFLASDYHDIGGMTRANHNNLEDEVVWETSMNMFSAGSSRTPEVHFTQKPEIRELWVHAAMTITVPDFHLAHNDDVCTAFDLI
jgi:hypothetical protein